MTKIEYETEVVENEEFIKHANISSVIKKDTLAYIERLKLIIKNMENKNDINI